MKRAIGIFTLCLFACTALAQESPDVDQRPYAFADPAEASPDVLALVRSVPAETAAPALSRAQWRTFGKNLERALASGHEGLQNSALRLIIHYGDNLSLGEEAAFDVMRIYRNHEDDRVRRMAVVTLAEMDSDWAMRFMDRAVHFEKSPVVKQTMEAVLTAYHAGRPSS